MGVGRFSLVEVSGGEILGNGIGGGEVYGAGGKELAVWETVRYARDIGGMGRWVGW